MEADWAVEIGPEMPVIDALWPGLVDLLAMPERIAEIAEAAAFAPLARALLRMHEPIDPVETAGLEAEIARGSVSHRYAFWSAKCDLWEPEAWDADEMEAGADEAQAALACYIDMLPRSIAPATRLLFADWRDAERCAEWLAKAMREEPLCCCRIDLVVRAAVTAEAQGFGITAYVTACGADREAAAAVLGSALERWVRTLAWVPLEHFIEAPRPVQ